MKKAIIPFFVSLQLFFLLIENSEARIGCYAYRGNYLPVYFRNDIRGPAPLSTYRLPQNNLMSWNECQSIINSRKGKLICSVLRLDNAGKYLYSLVNIKSRDDYVNELWGFYNINDCKKSLIAMMNTGSQDFYCTNTNREESKFSIYSTKKRRYTKGRSIGADTLDKCLQDIANATPAGLACLRKSDREYGLFISKTREFVGDTFSERKNCLPFLKSWNSSFCYKVGTRYFFQKVGEVPATEISYADLDSCQNNLRENHRTTELLGEQKEFSFFHDSPIPVEENSIKYPRNHLPVYRGAEPLIFPLSKALAAMLGDRLTFIESKLFKGIRLSFQKSLYNSGNRFIHRSLDGVAKNSPYLEWTSRGVKSESDFLDVLFGIRSSFIIDSIQDEILMARKLVNQTFNFASSSDKSGLLSRVADYSDNARYEDKPVDIIFSSFFQQTAVNYGAGVTVIKEIPGNERMLDLTFYNKESYGWKGKGDSGECIHPGYIMPDEISGYHMHTRGDYKNRTTHRVSFDQYSVQKYEPLKLAFYKHVYRGNPFVLVFKGYEGENSLLSKCLRRDRDGIYKYCEFHNSSHFGSNSPLEPFVGEAKLIGIIASCLKEECFLPPASEIAKLARIRESADSLENVEGHEDTMKQVQSVRINGNKSARFFPLDAFDLKN